MGKNNPNVIQFSVWDISQITPVLDLCIILHFNKMTTQVEIAATDFDIIMYSFDAWSFGALVEDRKQKEYGGNSCPWLKNWEVEHNHNPYKVIH